MGLEKPISLGDAMDVGLISEVYKTNVRRTPMIPRVRSMGYLIDYNSVGFSALTVSGSSPIVDLDFQLI